MTAHKLAVVQRLDSTRSVGIVHKFDETVHQTVTMATALDFHIVDGTKRRKQLSKIHFRAEKRKVANKERTRLAGSRSRTSGVIAIRAVWAWQSGVHRNRCRRREERRI